MKHFLKRMIEKTGYGLVDARTLRHLRTEKPITRDDFFNLYFSKVPKEFFFVQVGAHDGVHSDPLHDYITTYNLRGVALEPQPDVFKKLVATYEHNPSVVCINAAIGRGMLTFYTVKDEYKNEQNFDKMTRIASFDKETLKHSLAGKIPRGADPEAYIQKTPVKVLSFEDLKLQRVDLLQIDAEGYDYEILKMFDFDAYAPSLINFESSQFSDATQKECDALLTSKGYRFFRYGGDTCAYKP